jgi:cytidine deaminase
LNEPVPVSKADLGALVALAREARQAAYAPYSRYAVGAAVLTADGRRFSGVNIENAMYGATVCAERVAIWTAVAAGARDIRALAVVTPGGGAPCGFCRQVMHEFAGPDLIIALAAPEGAFELLRLAELLPRAWGPADLDPDSA